MSNDKAGRHRLRSQALAELRGFGADVDRLDGAAATRLGLNRTDLRVMELLNRSGPMGAGELAAATELTSAAVTTVIDRLVRRDVAARRYDPTDRRRVVVEPTAHAAELSRALFADLLAGIQTHLAGYSDAELATIISFVRGTRAVFAQHIEAMRGSGQTGEVPGKRTVPPDVRAGLTRETRA